MFPLLAELDPPVSLVLSLGWTGSPFLSLARGD